jgi:hypothetical protein
MSKNHQFIEFETQTVARWTKTVPHMVSGKRVNPYKTNEHIDFVLKTDQRSFNFELINKTAYPNPSEKFTFVYEDEVVEIYSEMEEKLFQRLNKGLIERGLLKKYEGIHSSIDTSNALSDEDINTIATITNLLVFKKRLKEITSSVTIERVIAAVKAADRKASFVTAAQERRDAIKE